MKRKNINFTLALGMLLTIGCSDDSKVRQLEEKEISMRASIVEMLTSIDKRKLSFTLTDTTLKLDNETELVLWKKSFLNQDSSVYTGEINVDYTFTSEPKHLLFQQYQERHSELEDIMGIIQFNITDNNGNMLVLNPQYSTVLRFHPKLKMLATTYFHYDSSRQKFSTPMYFYEKRQKVEVDNGQIAVAIEIDDDFSGELGQGKKQQYKTQSLTKTEIIGYEMTLKNFGFYYISRENREQNLQTVKLNINAKSKDAIDWTKVKAFLFTNQSNYNYYLTAENLGAGNFMIIPAEEYKELKLPLECTYTLLLLGIDGDQSYFSKRDVKLESVNNLSVNLKNVKFDRLLKEIKNL